MKTSVLKKIYLYLSFIRQELPALFNLLDLDVESYSSFDTSLKTLMTLIDDAILSRQHFKHFISVDYEGSFKFNPDGTVTKVSDLDINCSAVDIDKPTE